MSSEDKHNFGAPDTPSDFTVPQRDGDASEYGSAKGLEPVWVRLSLEYGENTPSMGEAQVVYSTVSGQLADGDAAVADSIVELIRKAQQMYATPNQVEDTERLDELAKSLENSELTFEKLSEMWADSDAVSDAHNGAADGAASPGGAEERTQPLQDTGEFTVEVRPMPSSDSTVPGKNQRKAGTSEVRLGLENIIDPAQEEELHRRRVLARGASHDDIVQKLIALTGERPELVAYELGETEVQVYVLCGVDSDGYLNVFQLRPEQQARTGSVFAVGEPLEDYVAWLVDQLPVTGAALEDSPTIWVPLFGGADELEFLTDADAAALLDVDIDVLTALLLTRGERQFAVAPAGAWTLVAGMPDDLLALIDDVQCTALVAEGNENQQHLVVIVPPEEPDSLDEDPADAASLNDWVQSVLGVPTDPEVMLLELRWQGVPKQLTRPISDEQRQACGAELADVLLDLPGMPLESAETRDARERSVEVLADLFGVTGQQKRRLASYVHDVKNTLALESVLQLLGLPVELADVPGRRIEVSSISTARIFGEDESTLASPLDRSYRLVATDRQVNLEQWLDVMATGRIPFDFTHLPPKESALNRWMRGGLRGAFSFGSAAEAPVNGVSASAVARRGAQSAPDDAPPADTTARSGRGTQEQELSSVPGQQGSGVTGGGVPAADPADVLRTRIFRADGTVQLGLSAFFIALARRRRAAGRGAIVPTALASLFAMGGTAEVLLAPRLARLLRQTPVGSKTPAEKQPVQGEVVRAFSPESDGSAVSLGQSAAGEREPQAPAKRTLIDDLVESNRIPAVRGSYGSAAGQRSRLGARLRRASQRFFGL